MKKIIRFISVLMAVLLFTTTLTFASDNGIAGIMPLSDDRIISVRSYITSPNTGVATITFSIDCYGKMKSLGASKIRLYKKNSDGSKTLVKTFLKADYSSMYTTNGDYYASSYTVKVPSTGNYYAIVTFFAKDSSGTSTISYTTKTVPV